MNILLRKIVLFIFCLFLAYPSFALSNLRLPDSMIVITSDRKPLNNVKTVSSLFIKYGKKLEIHNLDDVEKFENRMSEGLPNNEATAKRIVESRIESMGKRVFEQELTQAYRGLALALRYQIQKYPVVIIDSTYFIYGVTDLRAVLTHYTHHIDVKEF